MFPKVDTWVEYRGLIWWKLKPHVTEPPIEGKFKLIALYEQKTELIKNK